MPAKDTCIYLGQALADYGFKDGHPFGPQRHDAFKNELIRQGLDKQLVVQTPVAASPDRIGLFQAKPKLTLNEDHTLSEPEMNTYACPWHHNLTAAIVSFRTAKALKRNPGSASVIHSFKWRNSAKFDWHSQQLMDLGLMEPGQWF